MIDDNTQFEAFWEASSLNRHNAQEFAQRLAAYDSDAKDLALEFPAAAQSLPRRRTKLNALASKRKSDRAFSGKPLSRKQLGEILASFYAYNGLEHRGYPSAGATYVTEVFAVVFNAEKYSGQVLYYDAETHGVVMVSDTAPSWDQAQPALNMNVTGTPGTLIVLSIFPDRATAKYGERGGRFALLEAGAAMQQLSLTIAQSSKLKGVAVGGMLDQFWKQALGLQDTDAHCALGYLVGT
jgi:SagB-type dehydrogenase family enzyme